MHSKSSRLSQVSIPPTLETNHYIQKIKLQFDHIHSIPGINKIEKIKLCKDYAKKELNKIEAAINNPEELKPHVGKHKKRRSSLHAIDMLLHQAKNNLEAYYQLIDAAERIPEILDELENKLIYCNLSKATIPELTKLASYIQTTIEEMESSLGCDKSEINSLHERLQTISHEMASRETKESGTKARKPTVTFDETTISESKAVTATQRKKITYEKRRSSMMLEQKLLKAVDNPPILPSMTLEEKFSQKLKQLKGQLAARSMKFDFKNFIRNVEEKKIEVDPFENGESIVTMLHNIVYAKVKELTEDIPKKCSAKFLFGTSTLFDRTAERYYIDKIKKTGTELAQSYLDLEIDFFREDPFNLFRVSCRGLIRNADRVKELCASLDDHDYRSSDSFASWDDQSRLRRFTRSKF